MKSSLAVRTPFGVSLAKVKGYDLLKHENEKYSMLIKQEYLMFKVLGQK